MNKIVFFLLILLFFSHIAIFGQQQNQQNQQQQFQTDQVVPIPAMRNVFFNTLWGSLVFGILKSSLHILDDEKEEAERYAIGEISVSFFEGSTYGGLAGFLFGLIFSFNNISYYDNDLLTNLINEENSADRWQPTEKPFADNYYPKSDLKLKGLVYEVPIFSYKF